MGDSATPMAKRKKGPQQVSEAVREAVERTVHATVGSAQLTRERAQEAVDEVVRSAEAGAEAVQKRVRGAIEERRPVTQEDLKGLRTELRAIAKRLDAIEGRLPPPRKPAAKRSGTGAAKRSGTGAAKRSAVKRPAR